MFNSIDFAVFLPLVFALYWGLGSKQIARQNVLIVVASYCFYSWWDYRFLLLILISTIVDYSVGRRLGNTQKESQRRYLLATSLVINLGILFFFKYYGFFIESFVSAFTLLGIDIAAPSLRILLPVGISFYTFQTLSYTIDVYRRRLQPTTDFWAFAAFVSFFPQLVAGPIERASQLLPQFQHARHFEYKDGVDGLRQILWGLFKKVVIADNCGAIVNEVFGHSGTSDGSTLALGAVFFAFQIYADFSGYSDMAIGLARLFGFRLMQNFAFPYFSRDFGEFWRRWHISLSTWFRDYVYLPLGGSRHGKGRQIRNVLIVFLLSGLWHGADWTFVLWGGLHALYFLPLIVLGGRKKYDRPPSLRDIGSMLMTFGLTTVAWVFFRAESLTHALEYLTRMMSPSLWMAPDFTNPSKVVVVTGLIIVLLVAEWQARTYRHVLVAMDRIVWKPIRWLIYGGLGLSLYFIGSMNQSIEFIYFQF